MRTIFVLFEDYREARGAVEGLVARHFKEDEMNLIVRESAAQDELLPAREGTGAVKDRGSGVIGFADGLGRLFAGREYLTMRDVGAVYVAGRMALEAAAGAAAAVPPCRLGHVLGGLEVPEELAEFYASGVREGGLLFWVRTDERQAAEAATILSRRTGGEISGGW